MAVQEVLTAALASEWTPKQALILDRTEDVESVVDAVQRVATQLPQVQLGACDMALILIVRATDSHRLSPDLLSRRAHRLNTRS